MLFEDRLELLRIYVDEKLKAVGNNKSHHNMLINVHEQIKLLRKLAKATDVEFVADIANPEKAIITQWDKMPSPEILTDANKLAILSARHTDVCKFIRQEHYDDLDKPSLVSSINTFMKGLKSVPVIGETLDEFAHNEAERNMRR